ncbi:unnamed protein product [Effrenium voratum]|nr:unnamed protein product [Effrenium voratum]
MKPQSAYVASRQAIRMGRAGTPVPERSLAFRLLQEFSQFAERACGCKALSNRAQVRRAVFHTTQSIDWDAFVEKRLQKDLSSIESIARMECPVTLPDKTMLALKVPESAPKRIIFAGKVLRKHLALTETLTCRGCHKRSRCRWFKAPPDAELTAGVRHVGRLLLGMGQYARAHLQHPETYPWYFNEANLEGARTLMRAIQESTWRKPAAGSSMKTWSLQTTLRPERPCCAKPGRRRSSGARPWRRGFSLCLSGCARPCSPSQETRDDGAAAQAVGGRTFGRRWAEAGGGSEARGQGLGGGGCPGRSAGAGSLRPAAAEPPSRGRPRSGEGPGGDGSHGGASASTTSQRNRRTSPQRRTAS